MFGSIKRSVVEFGLAIWRLKGFLIQKIRDLAKIGKFSKYSRGGVVVKILRTRTCEIASYRVCASY